MRARQTRGRSGGAFSSLILCAIVLARCATAHPALSDVLPAAWTDAAADGGGTARCGAADWINDRAPAVGVLIAAARRRRVQEFEWVLDERKTKSRRARAAVSDLGAVSGTSCRAITCVGGHTAEYRIRRGRMVADASLQPWQLPIFAPRACTSREYRTSVPRQTARRPRCTVDAESRTSEARIFAACCGPAACAFRSVARARHLARPRWRVGDRARHGLGLGGVGREMLRRDHILATDGDASILPFCERNLARNQGGRRRGGRGEAWWGDACGAATGQFDLIGADVVYASDLFRHGARGIVSGLLCTYGCSRTRIRRS